MPCMAYTRIPNGPLVGGGQRSESALASTWWRESPGAFRIHLMVSSSSNVTSKTSVCVPGSNRIGCPRSCGGGDEHVIGADIQHNLAATLVHVPDTPSSFAATKMPQKRSPTSSPATFAPATIYQKLVSPEFAVYRHLRTRDPCIDGVSLPKKLKIHRYMN